MLHLIPAPLHRMLYRVADRVRRRWWRFRRPRRSSVGIVAFDERGQVLLVRHSYGRPVWALPGGGVGRKEDPAAAAAREFREELGCELVDLIPIGTSEQEISGSRDLQHVFAACVAGSPRPDNREIIAAEFFDPSFLPRGCSRLVAGRVEQARAARSASVARS